MKNTALVLSNEYWELTIQKVEDKEYIYKLIDKKKGIIYSDQDYHYRIITSKKKGIRYAYLAHISKEYKAKRLMERKISIIDNESLIIEGKFEDIDLWITHEFNLKEGSRWLREYITLSNRGNKKVNIGFINFGFKKAIFRQYSGWSDDLDEYQLTSIPSRRFSNYSVDRRKKKFSVNDILYNPWISSEVEMPGYCSEGWLWGKENGGLLICKYNQKDIEFSRFSRNSQILPGRGAEDMFIIFGGTYFYEGFPELATFLDVNQEYSFGATKYIVYEGDYKEGYYLYRNHLEENGHKYKNYYNPPVHWNELYNLGWVSEKTGFFVDSTEYKPYTLEQLYKEAEIARDVGAESLYLDPGWNTKLGSEIWNEERFGSLKEFSKTIHDKYGLKLALHLMMNFEGENEPDEFYLRTKQGVKVVADPYINLYCVCANEYWIKEKTRRILELAKDGIDFFMFDFTGFSMFMADDLGCFSKEHGHEVPMRRQTHAENIIKVVQNVKKRYPKILIEAHDRGVKPRHPLYYQHNLSNSFDENWGFECMWNPMQDLLSGRATQLFEYNLAYSIPLYLHINENSDNDNMLQFWWYASLARHIGIGGLKDSKSYKYQALKKAMTLYHKVKPVLVRGTFYGINYDIHLHVSEENKTGVILAYNLTSRAKKTKIVIDLSKYELDFNIIEIFNGIHEKLYSQPEFKKSGLLIEFEVVIPSLSPIIALLTNQTS
ncbi:MAG: hypothetical protein EAX89_04020 [Candidatus Lokiarchaeota archaeon]|nr:hypothetical protein [Candidatus Lokiarchaeota archaeon]